MRRDVSLEKTLRLGKIEGKRRRGRQRMRWLDGIMDSMDTNLSKLLEIVKDREAWHAAQSRTQLSDCTTTIMTSEQFILHLKMHPSQEALRSPTFAEVKVSGVLVF